MEAADADVDGVDGAAAEQFEEGVARLLQTQTALDVGAVGAGEVDGTVAAEEVGRVQQVDVQGLALDPFTAVQETPQLGCLVGDFDSARVLDRRACAQLISDRADPAHPCRDVGWLGVGTAAQERLEEPRGFVDLKAGRRHGVALDGQVEGALALHARQGADVQDPRSTVRHDPASLSYVSKAATLKVLNRRSVSRSSRPSRRSSGIRAGRFTDPDGPKQP